MKKALRISFILLLTVLILGANTVFSAALEEAVDVREVTVIRDEKHAAYVNRLNDGVYTTYVSYKKGEKVSALSSEQIGYAYIGWQKLPAAVKIAWLDRDQRTVATEDHTAALLNEYLPVPQEGIYGYTLTFSGEGAISELSAFTAGELPRELPLFKAPEKEPALMLIAAYPGEELSCFGGLLPTMADQGVPLQVVYLNPYNRGRQEECLRTLWRLGIQNEPIFLDTAGRRSLDETALKSNWEKNGEVSKELKNLIVTYRPSIIVTHGKNRYFPLMAEAETAYTIFSGVYKDIKGSPWLKKVYLSSESGNKNGNTYDFSTGYDRAAALYWDGYASLRTFHYAPYGEDIYILQHTNVGQDKTGNMLENVSFTAVETAAPTAEPTPEPTEEPTQEPTQAPTEEPDLTPEPTQAPTDAPTQEPTQAPVVEMAPVVQFSTPAPTPLPSLADTKAVLLPVLLSLVLSAVLFVAMIALKKRVKKRLPVTVGIAVPPLSGIILCVGLYQAASLNKMQAAEAEAFNAKLAEEAARTPLPTPTAAPTFTPAPTAVPTAEPTAEPTAAPKDAPTPEPTQAPTPEPVATPDPDAGLYTDGEEIVEQNADAGKWVYKNSTLSIEITQYTGVCSKMEFPYYVADIHMRADEFRSGFGHEGRAGAGKDSAMNIAKRYHAVMMVTGDNLIHMDKDKKGVLIRDGWIYQSSNKGDLMLWHPETMSIELVPKEKITSAQLVAEDGVENCISFGPILIQDGNRVEEKVLEKNWLFKTNPRVGVGMVEPGHLIVIVGGYRSDYPKANLGWNLNEFTDLFTSFGCQQAYNMDGGVSACLVFMGERLNKGGNKKDWSQLRTLPDGLLFGYSALVSK